MTNSRLFGEHPARIAECIVLDLFAWHCRRPRLNHYHRDALGNTSDTGWDQQVATAERFVIHKHVLDRKDAL